MRLDKYLKVSRLIKSSKMENELVDTGLYIDNDKPTKPR